MEYEEYMLLWEACRQKEVGGVTAATITGIIGSVLNIHNLGCIQGGNCMYAGRRQLGCGESVKQSGREK